MLEVLAEHRDDDLAKQFNMMFAARRPLPDEKDMIDHLFGSIKQVEVRV